MAPRRAWDKKVELWALYLTHEACGSLLAGSVFDQYHDILGSQ